MTTITRRRYQRADIDGNRFLFLATMRRYEVDGEAVTIEHNEILRVIETPKTAKVAKIGVMTAALKAAAMKFAGVQE